MRIAILEDDPSQLELFGHWLALAGHDPQRFEYGEVAGVSGGFRTDYSSAFGRGSKPFTFPRGDAYLRISSFNSETCFSSFCFSVI